jgi:hypothetical protein
MYRFAWIALLLGFLSVFASCTPQKRLANLIKRHPELVRDTTITDYDTTIIDIPAVHQDSVVHINTFTHDTVIIEKERLRIKTYVHKDSVFIEGECMGIKDTIVSVEEIKVPYIVNSHRSMSLWEKCMIALIILLAINALYKAYVRWKDSSQ